MLWGDGHVHCHVTYGGELLYLWIWCSYLVRSAQSIVAAYFSTWQPKCPHDISPCKKDNTHITKMLDGLSYEKICGGTITQLRMWWQDGRHNKVPSLNFLGTSVLFVPWLLFFLYDFDIWFCWQFSVIMMHGCKEFVERICRPMSRVQNSGVWEDTGKKWGKQCEIRVKCLK